MIIKRTKLFLLVLCLQLLVCRCTQEENVLVLPRVSTQKVELISTTEGKFHAIVLSMPPESIQDYGFELTKLVDNNTRITTIESLGVSDNSLKEYQLNVNLSSNSSYFVIAFLKVDGFMYLGNPISFRTK